MARTEEEPIVPRFCVAPTIQQCLIAVEVVDPIFVYRTVNKVKAVEPFDPYDEYDLPFDKDVTNEGWIIRHTQIKFFGEVILGDIDFDTSAACYGCANHSKEVLKEIRKEKNIFFKKAIGQSYRKQQKLKDLKYA